MKILWITNMALPQVAEALGLPVNYGGGWLEQLSRKLSAEHELTVAFPMDPALLPVSGTAGTMHYAGIPFIASPEDINENNNQIIREVIEACGADIIQIWGTEYLHSYAVFQVCKNLKLLNHTLVYIQGLVSVYKDHYWGYINDSSIHRPTLKDRLRKTGPNLEYEDFCRRSRYEIEILKQTEHVMGRTAWDRYYAELHHPDVIYHFCNETLRPAFYEGKWSLSGCERHRIFVSQSSYPIKGFHLALQAVAGLKEKYPDIRLYTTGAERKVHTLHDKIRETRYERYIRHLIERYHLEDHVYFAGKLDAEHMKDQYLKAHVFLSASSIENSPNSVGEAMLLGTPVVSSDVGGVSSMIDDGKEGLLYPADQIDKMSACIEKVFSDDRLAEELSENERARAAKTHDPEVNYKQLLSIYAEVTGGKL